MANKGDVVLLEYSGRLATDGSIFDTTDEGEARTAGIFEADTHYGPKTAVFGTRTIMPGIEEAILSLQLGERKEFSIPAKKAFGDRNPNLVRMLPEKEFAAARVKPIPGMAVTLDGVLARVKSVTSGRVVVDFNHPLAGEDLVYSLQVNQVIHDEQKKIEAIIASFRLSGKVVKDGERFKVTIAPGSPKGAVDACRQTLNLILAETQVNEGKV